MTVGGKTYSFAETERLVRAAARGLAGNGIGHRDFLALMLPNTAEFIIGWYAACLRGAAMVPINPQYRSEEHTSELQSLMRISYAVFCLQKNTTIQHNNHTQIHS